MGLRFFVCCYLPSATNSEGAMYLRWRLRTTKRRKVLIKRFLGASIQGFVWVCINNYKGTF